jgi:23S rRNA (uracil1939-C5)-methyltransferase
MPEVTIERLGRAGDGIAGPLRLPFALPSERWRIGAAGEATLLAASPERVSPPCPHFGSCGGCALQHAADGWVADWKAGGCLVVRPEILAARPALGELTGLGASRSSVLRLTVTSGPAGLDVDVAGGRGLDAGLRLRLAGVAEAADLARLSWDGAVVVERRPPHQPMGGARVVPPPAAFLQATAEGERALVDAVREACGGAGRIADLFAGCGSFALPLAAASEVHAVEGEAAMLEALGAAARGARLGRVTTAARDLFRRPLLAAELARVEAVVIDPPRAGAEAQSRELARSAVARVAAVSCDPATFARDARLLVDGGFRLDWVQPVDQFRWSGHVELAAGFSR